MENIRKVLYSGEKIELLVDKTENLRFHEGPRACRLLPFCDGFVSMLCDLLKSEDKLEGRIIPRIKPSDVTINIGKDEVVPKCLGDERWGEIIHDNTVRWIARVPRYPKSYIYVTLSRSSKWTAQSDKKI